MQRLSDDGGRRSPSCQCHQWTSRQAASTCPIVHAAPPVTLVAFQLSLKLQLSYEFVILRTSRPQRTPKDVVTFPASGPLGYALTFGYRLLRFIFGTLCWVWDPTVTFGISGGAPGAVCVRVCLTLCVCILSVSSCAPDSAAHAHMWGRPLVSAFHRTRRSVRTGAARPCCARPRTTRHVSRRPAA